LEVCLFVLGAVCLLVELFVLPGFGIFGLGGILLMVASLILASQTFVLPSNEYQLRQFPKSMGIVSAGIVGLWVGAFVLGRYMDRLPLFRHFSLPAPQGESLEQLRRRESLADFSELVGQVGVVATPLRPAGKVRFGERLIDVVSSGDAFEVGDQVRVERVDGTRVTVTAPGGDEPPV
jgi:membrane-bound ClpP family serine protease